MGIYEKILGRKSDDGGFPDGLKNMLEALVYGEVGDVKVIKSPGDLLSALGEISDVVSASLKGEKCPNCGKVHGEQEVPDYDESDGLEAEVEYTPKKFRAMQLLPHNVVDVMEFLFDNRVNFAFKTTEADEDRLLMLTGGKIDIEEDELSFGRWAVVSGSYGTKDLAFTAVGDTQFRRMFQPTASRATDADLTGSFPVATESTAVESLEHEADDHLARAERDALSAFED